MNAVFGDEIDSGQVLDRHGVRTPGMDDHASDEKMPWDFRDEDDMT